MQPPAGNFNGSGSSIIGGHVTPGSHVTSDGVGVGSQIFLFTQRVLPLINFQIDGDFMALSNETRLQANHRLESKFENMPLLAPFVF